MEQESVNIVIVGHVDHGKSTLIGRLMYDTNCLPPSKIEEIKAASEHLGKVMEFSFVMDHLEEERKQGITIDTAQIFFKTAHRSFVIIDTPGHRDFMKNMITGTSMAEAALLIIDAAEGVMDQTRRHCYVLHLLGFHHIIVAVNKMDLVNYSETAFQEIKHQIEAYIEPLNLEITFIIPISAFLGDNIASVSSQMDWYHKESLLEILNTCTIQKETRDELCLPVQDIYDFVASEQIAVGRVESGTLHKDSEVLLLPENRKISVKNVMIYGKSDLQSAGSGECIGFTVQDGEPIKRGDILVDSPFPDSTDQFHGNIFWMAKDAYQFGDRITYKGSTQEVACTISRIIKKFDPASLELVEKNCKTIHETEVAEVVIRTEQKVAVTPYNKLQVLGRFVLEKNGSIVAGGIIP